MTKTKTTEPRSSTNSKYEKHEYNTASHVVIKLLETNDKENILKRSQRKKRQMKYRDQR